MNVHARDASENVNRKRRKANIVRLLTAVRIAETFYSRDGHTH